MYFAVKIQKKAKILFEPAQTMKNDNLTYKQIFGEAESVFGKMFFESGVCRSVLDEKLNILLVNKKFVETTGYSEQEIVGQPFSILSDKREYQYIEKNIPLLKNKTYPALEKSRKIFLKNGQYAWGSMRLLMIENNEKTYYTCEVINTTNLVESQKQTFVFQNALENNPLGIHISEKSGKIIYVNKKYTEITGYSRDELLGQCPRILKSGRQNQLFYKNLWQTILSGKTWEGIMENKRKDGTLYWEKATISPVFNEKKKIDSFVAMKLDITVQKNTQTALAQSEEQFRILAENSSDAVALIENDEITYLSPAYKRILGYSPQEIISKGFRQAFASIIHPDDVEKIRTKINIDRLNQKKTTRYDYRIKTADGKYVWLEDVVKRTYDENGKLLKSIVNSRDITERKKTENRLLRINQQLKMLTASRRAVINSTNEDSIISNVCDIITRDNYFRIAAVVYIIEGEKFMLKYNAGNDEVLQQILNLQKQKSAFISELPKDNVSEEVIERNSDLYALVNKYNIYSYISVPLIIDKKLQGFLIVFANNQTANDDSIIGLIENIANDLTLGIVTIRSKQAKILANQELEKNEEQLKKAQKIAQLGNWELDIATNKLTWSDEIYRIFGAHPQSFKATFEGFVEFIHPDDREFVIEAYNRSLKNKEPYDIVHRIIQKNGEIRYVNEKCHSQFDPNDNPIKSVGVVVDITEKIKSQNEVEKSKKGFENLFNNIPVPLYRTSVDGKILMANHALLKMMEFDSFEEMLSINLNEKNKDTSFDRNIFLKEMERNGQVVNFQTFWKTNKGKILAVEENAVAIKDENQKILYFEGSAVDISDRLKNIKKIKDKEEQFRFLSQSATYLISQNNVKDILHYLSTILTERIPESLIFLHAIDEENFMKIIGYNMSVELKNIKTVPTDELDKFVGLEFFGTERFNDIFQSEELFSIKDFQEIVNNHWIKEKELVSHLQPFEFKKAFSIVIRNSLNHSVGLFILTQSPKRIEKDFLETFIHQASVALQRKNLEELILDEKHKAEQANKAKTEFLANVSHEIRTPLNAIIGFSGVLSKKMEESPDLKHYSKNINKAGKNLLMVINDILDLSKIESGRIEIQYSTTNLKNIITEVAEIFALSAEEKNLDFKIIYKKNVPELILTDFVRIRQVLFNLLGNAVKFTHQGSITLSVEYKGVMSRNNTIDLLIKVIDTGIGITPGNEEKVFTPFMQQDSQTTRKYGGTGLGLPISKRLLEMMNGHIWFDSEPNVGSTFYVLLEDVKVIKHAKEKAQNLESFDPDNIDFEPANVLLVEDNDFNREFIINILEAYPKLTIDEAENGKKALDMIQQNHYDIVLVDIEMPIMNGYQMALTMQKMKLKIPPLIAITAYAMKEQRQKFEHAFNEYLNKPIDWKNLVFTISKYLDYKTLEEKKQEQLKENTIAKQKNKNIVILDEITKNELRNRLQEKYLILTQALSYKDARELSDELGNIAKTFNNQVLLDFNHEFFNSLKTYNFEKAKKLLLLLKDIFKEEK